MQENSVNLVQAYKALRHLRKFNESIWPRLVVSRFAIVVWYVCEINMVPPSVPVMVCSDAPTRTQPSWAIRALAASRCASSPSRNTSSSISLAPLASPIS